MEVSREEYKAFMKALTNYVDVPVNTITSNEEGAPHLSAMQTLQGGRLVAQAVYWAGGTKQYHIFPERQLNGN